MGAPYRLSGTAAVASAVGTVADPQVILCRTNAGALLQARAALDAGRRVALAGGGLEIRQLALAALDLKAAGRTSNPELAAFSSWHAVQAYVRTDAAGAGLAAAVRLIDSHGAAMILGTVELSRQPRADLLVATAHRDRSTLRSRPFSSREAASRRYGRGVAGRGFELVCEIEPPVRPDLTRVRHQIGVLSLVADSFLIPDNHIGRATVSSVAVAHEVQAMGARSIACLNSRDRNLLGFRRDLLTAAAYGVDRFLFVYGDKPAAGGRTSELTVRAMIGEARDVAADPAFAGCAPFRVGVTSGLHPVPGWKTAADFVFAQVSFSVDALLRWRDSTGLQVPVYAGVMVLASAGMARRLAGTIPDIDIPAGLVDAVERDRGAGVDAACEQVLAIRDSGAFDGVHLVPVSRYRDVAARLEHDL